MMGCVGRDSAGEVLRRALGEAGVGVEAVGTCVEPTGTATILVGPDGENTIVLVPGANHVFGAEDVERQRGLLVGASIVLVQLETRMEVLAKVVEIAGSAEVPVMLDPAPAAKISAEVLRGLAWFTPNETEAEFYLRDTGWVGSAPGMEEQCRYFQGLGPRNVLLKLGGAGAAMLTEDGRFVRVAAPQVAVVNTTGAGDTLNGALAAELALGCGAEAALRFAVAAASLSTTRDGAAESQPTRSEVESFAVRANDL